jgi:hypothetical protein
VFITTDELDPRLDTNDASAKQHHYSFLKAQQEIAIELFKNKREKKDYKFLSFNWDMN